jgi:riboflavin-specific deaminase-like protein
MQPVTMTDELWQHLRSMRDGFSRPAALPQDPGLAGLSLYEPLALRNGPFVMAQVGQSLDGRVATPAGDAQNVSGCDGIAHLHRCRALVDAVVVGVGTVVADNPSLSVRAVSGRSPVRVVIDPNGRIPPDSKMLHDRGAPVLIMQAEDVPVRASMADTIWLPRGERGFDPGTILDALFRLGLASIMVEGGANTIARFVDADLVDRLHVSVAPIIIGSGPAGISLAPVERLSDVRRPDVSVYNIGTDIVFDCHLRAGACRAAASAERKDVQMANTA